MTDRRKLWFPPPTPPPPLSLLERLPKIKSNISSALSKCLPSFDLAGRPPFPPSPPLILRVSGGCEVNVSIMFFPFKVRHFRAKKTCCKVPERGGGGVLPERLSLETAGRRG